MIPGVRRKKIIKADTPKPPMLALREAFAQTIQQARGNNYPVHYDSRQYVKSMPADMVLEFSDLAAESLPLPSLNIFGATCSGFIPAKVDQLLKKIWTPAMIHIFNPWYLSADGWDNFQDQWKALPEPEDIFESYIQTDKKATHENMQTLWIPQTDIRFFCPSKNKRQITNLVQRMQA